MAHLITASERMPSEDALFLYLEKPDMPLHIGSVSTFDGIVPFGRIKKHILSRLPLIPRYRQRVVFPPLHIGHPTWENDPEFDIRSHIHHVRLRRGTDAELYEVAGRLFGEIMDRSKPLWDLTVVDGLDGGRGALIARVHHCLVDGVAGVGIMNTLLDTSRRPRRVPVKRAEAAAPVQDTAAMIINAVLNSYSEVVGKILSAQSAALDLLQALVADPPLTSVEQLARLVPELLKPVERLPFNKPVRGERKYCATQYSLAEIGLIRERLGGKLNDVALAVITRAVGRYAEMHGQSTEGRIVRMMVPVNLRKDPNNPGLGNHVSFLPVDLPLDLRDMRLLLTAVHEITAGLKRTHVAEIISLAATWLGVTPAPLQAAVGLLGNVLPIPPFNMVCTNVPGPPVPLYALGREMLTYYPYVPIGNEMGVCLAMESYNGRFFFGLTGDSGCAPDLEKLRDLLDEAYQELRIAAGLAESVRPKRSRKTATPAHAVRRARKQNATETLSPVAFEPALAGEAVRDVLAEAKAAAATAT